MLRLLTYDMLPWYHKALWISEDASEWGGSDINVTIKLVR